MLKTLGLLDLQTNWFSQHFVVSLCCSFFMLVLNFGNTFGRWSRFDRLHIVFLCNFITSFLLHDFSTAIELLLKQIQKNRVLCCAAPGLARNGVQACIYTCTTKNKQKIVVRLVSDNWSFRRAMFPRVTIVKRKIAYVISLVIFSFLVKNEIP